MTNKTISITCDSDNVVALNAFSKALAEMAQGNPVVGELKYNLSIDTTEATASLEQLREQAGILDTTAQQVESLAPGQYPTDDYKQWYEEAMKASNEAGYVGVSAADTIRTMGEMLTLSQSYGTLMHSKTQQVESLAPEQYPTDKWVEMVHPDHDTQRMARSDAELEQMVADGWVYPDASDDLTETPTLDSEGLPWDARIHSTNKATVADGTWRLRRKPKELDEAQWQAEIKTVRNELEQLMAIDIGIDPASQDGDKTVELNIEPAAVFAPVPPPVTEATHMLTDVKLAGEPIPVPGVENAVSQAYTATVEPIAPPVIVPPPPVANVEPMTFPKLMTFLTERTGRITLEQVNELVAKHGLTRIDQLSQRPELTAAFVADVKTLLGE